MGFDFFGGGEKKAAAARAEEKQRDAESVKYILLGGAEGDSRPAADRFENLTRRFASSAARNEAIDTIIRQSSKEDVIKILEVVKEALETEPKGSIDLVMHLRDLESENEDFKQLVEGKDYQPSKLAFDWQASWRM